MSHLQIMVRYNVAIINAYALDQAYFEKMWEQKLHEAIGTKYGPWTFDIKHEPGHMITVRVNGDTFHELCHSVYTVGNVAFEACQRREPLLQREPTTSPQVALLSPAFLRAMSVAELEALLIEVQTELANREPQPAHVQP